MITLTAVGTTTAGPGGRLLSSSPPAASALQRAPAAAAWRPYGGCKAGTRWGAPRRDLARRVVQLVNAHRQAIGLPRLNASTPLRRSALWKARHMARFRYMEHDDPAPPVARSPAERLAACGFGGWGLAENIAAGYRSPEAVMRAWLSSAGHRANIESPSWSLVGVGAAQGRGGKVFWTQNFGTGSAGHPSTNPG